MDPRTKLTQYCSLVLCLLLVFPSSIFGFPSKPISFKFHAKNTTAKGVGFETRYYPQTLDHFGYQPESYTTFKQKYVISHDHWGGASLKSPILVYLGDEAPLDDATVDGLILKDYGEHFKALLLFIEHRFYGESIPYGMSKEKVMKNARIRGYFSSAQALADYAELILHVKQQLNAPYSPVIVLGGSYGGMLASWFRLKYPHVALGALASSAPILLFDNIISPNHGYYSVVTKDFKVTTLSDILQFVRPSSAGPPSGVRVSSPVSTSSDLPIPSRNSGAVPILDPIVPSVSVKKSGTSSFNSLWIPRSRLNNTSELKDFLKFVYNFVAQYNVPSIANICSAINDDGDNNNGGDIMRSIYAGVIAFSGNQTTCQEVNWETSYTSDTILGWDWQTCSEMVMPLVYGTRKDSMFPKETFNLTNYLLNCKNKYNIVPRPHWITTYYGGKDLKLVLKTFGSNIIFSNGLKDPYSSGSVLENISDTIVAVYTINGTHAMDIIKPSKNDPEWLIHQRKIEVWIIDEWLRQHYANLKHDLH